MDKYTVSHFTCFTVSIEIDLSFCLICYPTHHLQRTFSPRKWISLVILTVGVAIVQISGGGDQHHQKEDADTAGHNRFVGLVAVLCAACTSGFSGVYFEKILKGSTTTLWLRNVQMGLPSIIIAFIGVYAKDAKAVAEQGFLGGYSPIVWTVVTVQAAGGLIVAVVVRYADNVLKVSPPRQQCF